MDRGSIPVNPVFAFTRRESEVASCVIEGKSTREIAEALQVDYETIRSHKKRLMDKLNVHNTTQLLKILLENGFRVEK